MSSNCVSFNLWRIVDIRKMTLPQMCANLQPFARTMQRMCAVIPEFLSVISLLAHLLERVHTLVAKPTRLASGRILLSKAGW